MRLFSVKCPESLFCLMASAALARVGNKAISLYMEGSDFSPARFHKAVTWATLKISEKCPTLKHRVQSDKQDIFVCLSSRCQYWKVQEDKGSTVAHSPGQCPGGYNCTYHHCHLYHSLSISLSSTNISMSNLHTFTDQLFTDGWRAYQKLPSLGYIHRCK